jgi:hypothetical protein
MEFRNWLEGLTEPPPTNRDPASIVQTNFRDEDDDKDLENEELPMGMRKHTATSAYPELTVAKQKKMKKR